MYLYDFIVYTSIITQSVFQLSGTTWLWQGEPGLTCISLIMVSCTAGQISLPV